MKRLLSWIFILFAPVSFWFAFTDDGNKAFQLWFAEPKTNMVVYEVPANRNGAQGLIIGGSIDSSQLPKEMFSGPKDKPFIVDKRGAGKRILIPAHTMNNRNIKPQSPYLHVEIKGRNTSYRKAAAGLLLVDEDGRRTGYDPINKKYYQEIPNSKYEIKNAIRVSPPLEVAVVSVKPAKPQYFRIEVIGHQNITYELSVSRHPFPGSRIFTVMPRHVIKKGELHSYSANLSNNPENGFLSSMASESLSASYTTDKNVKAEAFTSADMKLDVNLPVISLNKLQQQSPTLSYFDRSLGFSLLYQKTAKVEDEENLLYFGEGKNSVLMKVLPHKKDPFQYLFNKAHGSLQSYASKALPRSIGLFADGDGYSIYPVGITGTKQFINKNGVKGIQTYVVHKTQHYQEDSKEPDINYEFQGPVYIFVLKPDQQVSPVLVVSPIRPIGSDLASDPQGVWDMANSVELVD